MSGDGGTFRVTIDVRRIQANLLLQEGGLLSEQDVRRWLLSVGFRPEQGGTWLASELDLRVLDPNEVTATERIA
jgi:hypothetical protein